MPRTSRFAPGSSIPRIVLQTPKSAMLVEQTRELYNLRAQLETERSEKGLLEVQIKQNEEKIKKLNQDHKKLQQTIQDLKNDIVIQNTKQMKRRLCREVAQKETEISKLNEVLGNLMEEKSLVQEKLRFAEKQIMVCMDRITELDFKVFELTADVEEHENAALREQLTSLKHSNKRLCDIIRKFTIKHAQELNIATSMSSITANEEENMEITPGDCLDHLFDYVDRIGLLYKDEKERVKTLQAELQAKHIDELGRRLMDLEKKIIILKEQGKPMDHANVDLEQGKKRMQEKMARCEQELAKINEQKFELVAKLESLTADVEEHENAALREQLTSLKHSNKRLCDIIRKFTIKHAQELNIATSMSSITANEEENMEITPGDCLDHLFHYVDRIGLLYKDEKERVKTLQAELQAKHIDELGRRIMDLEKKIIILKEQGKPMDHANVDLEQGKKRMQEKMARCEQELAKINEQKFELVAKMESLANDYDTHKHKCATQRLEYKTQIRRLESEITGPEKFNSTLTKENKILNEEVITLQSN